MTAVPPLRGRDSIVRFLLAVVRRPSTLRCMLDPELLERITVRRAELDELEEQRVKQLTEVRAERDELAVAGTYSTSPGWRTRSAAGSVGASPGSPMSR